MDDLSLHWSPPGQGGFCVDGHPVLNAAALGLLALLNPRFRCGQVQHDAARRQVEAAWELSAALHFVDGRFGKGDDLPQFMAADGAAEGEPLGFLGQP